MLPRFASSNGQASWVEPKLYSSANIFAAAVVLSYFYPIRKRIFYSIASMVAFSRVYIGVHYPGDIIFGGLLGYGLAWVVLSLWVIIKMSMLL